MFNCSYTVRSLVAANIVAAVSFIFENIFKFQINK